MKILNISIAIALALSAAPTAKARDTAIDDGNDLLSNCSQYDSFTSGYCLGYVRGLTLGLNAYLSANDLHVCYPENVTWGQVRDVVVSYVRRNPASRNKGAIVLVGMAALEAWPCK